MRGWPPVSPIEKQIKGTVQTADGFLWLATQFHLVRFDGISFEQFSCLELFGFESPIRHLLKGRDDTLWLALDGGQVVRVKSGRVDVLGEKLGGDARAYSFIEDGEGALWISYHSGIVCRIKDGKTHRFGKERDASRSGSPPYLLSTDTRGRVWYAAGRKVGQIRDGKFQPLFNSDRGYAFIAPARDGGMWIWTGYELLKYSENGSVVLRETFRTDNREMVSAMLEDHEGRVWIGTRLNGLFCYSGGTFESLPAWQPTITSLFEDVEGNLWAGTSEGLNRIRPRAIKSYGAETGRPSEAIQSLCEDATGSIWAATKNGLIKRWNEGDWQVPAPNADSSLQSITCLAAEPSGAMWFGSARNALFRTERDRVTSWTNADGLRSETISSIAVTRKGDVWIAGNLPSGIYRVRDGKLTSIDLPTPSTFIGAIAEDHKGDVWIGGNRKLFRIHEDKISDESLTMSPLGSFIRCLYVAPDGALWIGASNGGLGRYKDGHHAIVTRQHGLYDDVISQMVPDDRGWVWFGASRGLFKVRQEDLNGVADGRLPRLESVRYGREEGLPDLQGRNVDAGAAIRSRDGRLWIPMGPTLLVIDPAKLRDHLDPPPITIKSVKVNDQVVASRPRVPQPQQNALNLADPNATLRIVPSFRRLEIEFAALTYRDIENVEYRYLLEGIDDRWTEIGSSRSASYPRLPAGQYRFKVTARNTEGNWNKTAATLTLFVEPFLWQRWWFQTGIALSVAGAIALAVRALSFRRLRLKLRRIERETALERERSRIASNLHDDLGTGLTHILLLNELALQDSVSPEAATARHHELANSARAVVKALDEAVWAINPRNDTLHDLIDYISHFAVQFLGAGNVTCRLDVPEDLPRRSISAEVRHHVFLVGKEALNNIVQHAQATEVRLQFEVSESSLKVTIRDNGKGFQIKTADPGADGLRNMKQRMEHVGGTIEITSTPGTGTQLVLACPWPSPK